MKRASNFTSTLLIALLAFSCGQHEEHDHEHSDAEATEEHSHDEDGAQQEGALWKANPETTTGISNMSDLLANMTDEQREDVDSYSELAEGLQAEFKMIFEKCTMTGEAHEQLHTYLVPMKGMFQNLASKDLNTCKEGYEHLEKHLLEYQNIFE